MKLVFFMLWNFACAKRELVLPPEALFGRDCMYLDVPDRMRRRKRKVCKEAVQMREIVQTVCSRIIVVIVSVLRLSWCPPLSYSGHSNPCTWQ